MTVPVFLLTFHNIGAIIISNYECGGFSMFFRKKTKKEKIVAQKTNYAGEKMDRLDNDGNLPFGWVTHNQKYVDMIESDMQPFREAMWNAKTDIEKFSAYKSFLLFLEDGKKHYIKYGECVGKYFEVYICDSAEANGVCEKYDQLYYKLKKGQE